MKGWYCEMKSLSFFKKILCCCALLTFIPMSCWAIQLSQPQELGVFYRAQGGAGGMVINNATFNNGDFYTKYRKNNKSSFGKGIAIFGSGDDALYLHYNLYANYDAKIGGKKANNTISVVAGGRNIIYKVRSNEGITFFPVHQGDGIIDFYTVFGRLKDGKFIKFFDTEDVVRNYLGFRKDYFIMFTNFVVQGDTLIMPYREVKSGKIVGEFRFKWDDKAQWFGVEHVVY